MRRPAGEKPPTSLEGQLLIAMPSLRDGPFARSVVYVCVHRRDGAMGLIINHRAPSLDFGKLMVQLDIVKEDDAIRLPRRAKETAVMRGGPVETGRGFVLHSEDFSSADSTVSFGDGICMTATTDILRAIAEDRGPGRAMLALGYAGWGSGQLESELMRNGWLNCEVDPDIIFDAADDAKYARALARLGVDEVMLSSDAGRA